MSSNPSMSQSNCPESSSVPPSPAQSKTQTPTASNTGTSKNESTKKRKAIEQRSPVWDHFEKIKNDSDVVVKARCMYCAKTYAAEGRKHGTSSLNQHMKSCLKNPHAQATTQALLTIKSSQKSQVEGESVVGTWTFNQEIIRNALAKMLIIDELPFMFVEGKGFRHFIEKACPRFKIPSRWTMSRNIWGIYQDDKADLKKMFKEHSQSISITTDTWTSIQRINYMCVTAHWIDTDWRLNKKVISFVPIYSHKGEEIAKALERCLVDWGIKNIFTVTVDNASSNDVALGFLKKKLVSWGCSAVKAEYMHMRCIAHILNLVVQDGLKMADSAVRRIRDCVRNSPNRLAKFAEFKDLLAIDCKKSLCLYVPTRWNSTYLMLDVALKYQKVFEAYESNDNSLSAELGDSVPSYLDWLSVKGLVYLLENFYEMTLRISGSLYVTSNTFLSEISDLSVIIDEIMHGEEEAEKKMGVRMKEKFRKYWGDAEKMNSIIFFATILDPRDKVEYIGVQFKQLFGEVEGPLLFERVKASLSRLFEDYVVAYSGTTSSKPPLPVPANVENIQVGRTQSKLKSQLKKQKAESGVAKKISELEVYLSEAIVDDNEDDSKSFDILRWWKVNNDRFPILSRMARDMLAVPISTVASESTFNTGGRVFDCFRSSLTPRIVEALICTQDWLRGPTDPIQVEETIEDVEKLEQELIQPTQGQSGSSSTNPTKSTIAFEDLGDS